MIGKSVLKQKDQDEFLHALAIAILSWQKVEGALFLIFYFLVGPHRHPKVLLSAYPSVLSAVYHSVINLNIRLKMIDAAAVIVLKDNIHLDKWKKLYERVRRQAVRRNELVHFGLVCHIGEKGNELRLKPSIFDVTQESHREYDLKQLKAWHESFIALANDLNLFLNDLPKALRSST
jgi:hypothetical protein